MTRYSFDVGGHPAARVLVDGHTTAIEVLDGNEWRETTAPNTIDRALRECVVMLAHQLDSARMRRARRQRRGD